MNKVIRSLSVLVLGIGVLGGCAASTSDPLPPAASAFPADAPAAGVAAPAGGAPAVVTVPVTTAAKSAPAAKPAPAAASSCDVVREALLTRAPTDINAAMKQLQADKTADAKAREEASDYLRYTDKDLKAMSVSLIRMYCS